MSFPQITEALIRRRASDSSFSRGYEYWENGAVMEVTQRGNQLQAEVEGSSYSPYTVSIALSDTGIAHASCSCPYDWGGDCKHIVAVLLAYVHNQEDIALLPAIGTMLQDLSRDQLLSLLTKLIEQHPHLTSFVENEVGMLRATSSQDTPVQSSTPRERRTNLDVSAFRRQVRYALRSLDHMSRSDAYWHMDEVANSIRQIIDQAREYLNAGDAPNAMLILEAVTEEYIDGWTELDDSDGDASGAFTDLGELWTEVILSLNLTQEEREQWADRFTEWQDEISDYGIDDVFDAPQVAALQGWDYPPLLRVLEGNITELGAWDEEAPWYADDLAVARLNVLERQGRHQEFLYLAEAEGQMDRYITKLVEVGRGPEAVEFALNDLSSADSALNLAQALVAHGDADTAVRVAEHGLNLDAPHQLALWLRDVATSVGNTELALQAAVVAVREFPTLQDYEAARHIAGENWRNMRSSVLAQVRQSASYLVDGKIDILLSEGMVSEAIASLGSYPGYSALEKVADAATESHPDWVIKLSRKQAEDIMDQGKANAYHHAVKWLRKARKAYLASAREADWDTYLQQLLVTHARKYKLMPMLRELS